MKKQIKDEEKIFKFKEKCNNANKEYELFRSKGFEEFKKITMYSKSFCNLIMYFKKYADKYESKDHRLINKSK